MSQRTRYHVGPSAYGWEGMMEGALRASVASKDNKQTLERAIGTAAKNAPGSASIRDRSGF